MPGFPDIDRYQHARIPKMHSQSDTKSDTPEQYRKMMKRPDIDNETHLQKEPPGLRIGLGGI